MLERYQQEMRLETIAASLKMIGFELYDDSEYVAYFSRPGTNWKLTVGGDRGYSTSLEAMISNTKEKKHISFPVWFLMRLLLDERECTIKNQIDFIIKNEKHLFDDSIPYLEKSEEIEKIASEGKKLKDIFEEYIKENKKNGLYYPDSVVPSDCPHNVSE